ncbi:MAG: DUF6110 family protein [Anaerovoracaceae bacterium]
MADLKELGIFAAGIIAGTVGLKVLITDEAKKVYAHCTAAGLRTQEYIMETASLVEENVGDILADAKEINEKKAQAREAKEGCSCGCMEEQCEANEGEATKEAQ